ncbi:glycosyltransferase family 2 protein [Microbacterium aurum]|uniref:glycosyltransferase family 2 protein n=1 Tax=Microbacterium aurum TaxID=36805 RepID=UPI0028EDE634|nr:glycosyltransferase family 2 protein [Microbacterium aurum]
MTTPDHVTAVIVTYNSADHIIDLLRTLPAAFAGSPYTVVVVDNGSSDGTAELVADREDVTLVRSQNTGFAAGVNNGVRAVASSGPILVLNPDATVTADAVPAMLVVLDRPHVGIVAPLMREADGSLSPSIRRAPTLLRAGGLSFTQSPVFAERVEDPKAYVEEADIDWAVGAALLIDRSCYDALGGFDETFFLYSEETDFCLRARDLGWRTVFTPAAEVMHIGGGSGESTATHTMKMVNRVRLYARRHGAVASACYFAIATLTELRRAVLGHTPSWTAFRALLQPRLRPPQLNASGSLIPR